MYQVLARKWRPQVFEDLVGQQTAMQTLQNALSSGRIAHAFLFSGPRGIGKTTCARILAKALNCQSSSGPVTRPCSECPSCVDISNSRSLDVLEIDGASNRGIDEVRELRESAKYHPLRDRFRVFIIDEVHMLTMEAFNALLKILEEPPPHVFFIFATTEQRKVPATIVSRCQIFEFRRIPDRVLVQRLSYITKEEQINISEKSLQMIAVASEGGLRDALGTLDQIIAFSGQTVDEKDVQAVLGLVDLEIMLDLCKAIAAGRTGDVLSILEKINDYGIDYKIFYNELLSFYRDLFLLKFSGNESGADPRLGELAEMYDEIQLLRICHQLVSIQNFFRFTSNLRFLFEVTLIKLSQIKRLVPLEELAEIFKKKPDLTSAVPSRPFVPRTAPPAAPAPVAAASAPVVTTSTPLLNGTDQRPFSDDFLAALISDLEVQNARLAAALEQAKFQRQGSRIRFFVPDAFYKMIRQDSRNQVDLETLLQQKLGEAVQVEFHKGDPPVENQTVQMATPETIVTGDPVVKEFIKTFQGKISKIELNKERY
jgi:DNA polymerase-3 subunit gamma/tau